MTLGSLGPLGEELGSGGQGTVYALPRSQPPLVYKAYSADALAELDTAVLHDLIALPGKLSGADRQRLTAAAAWPRDAVTDGGRVAGFTMALVPKRFHTSIRLMSGPQRRLGQTQLLLNPPDYLDRVGIAIDDKLRLELLADVAATIRLFHRIGLTVGDLSPNNLLYSATGTPRCHFIDCDAMRLHGRTALPQVETTDWEVRAGGASGTKDGDIYKFALFCVRLFAGDQSTTEPDALRRAGPGVHSLSVRALSANARKPPGLREWEEQLRAKPPVTVAVPRPRSAPAPAPAFVPPVPRQPGVLTRFGRRLTGFRRRTVAWLVVLPLALGYTVTHTDEIQAWMHTVSDAVGELGRSRPQEQADRIAALLVSSAPVRTEVKNAVGNLAKCKRLKTSAADLAAASSSRQRSLAAAKALEVTALVDGDVLKTWLAAAFQHSKAADDAYHRWGLKLADKGCRKSVRNGPDRRKGDKESAASTKAKQQFVKVWDRVGPGYGHPKVAYQDI
ncbi:hypothetical protein [Pseudosporangium ferrugineum]|uniref:hypothetical protein n=1 Tax=Pseudosporangium ferrugineum TaxID=439699 RepID=UPI0011B240A5|nr:hypothetical protein [Pseudosporangium ferrugineum]